MSKMYSGIDVYIFDDAQVYFFIAQVHIFWHMIAIAQDNSANWQP
jgi:hypothetical protein